jgi:hypothetical protein
MNWKLLSCLVGLLILPIVGYKMSLVAATPETTLNQGFSCPGPEAVEAQDFQVLAVRKWAGGVVALSRGLCPSGSPTGNSQQSVLSYRLVQRRGREWQLGSSGSHVIPPKRAKSSHKTESLIEYKVDTVARSRYSIFYGQVLSPKVSAVEVTFDNGKILRDKALDGLFALVAPGATGVCDVRMFGADNQILQRYELGHPNVSKAAIGNTCQPISGQL